MDQERGGGRHGQSLEGPASLHQGAIREITAAATVSLLAERESGAGVVQVNHWYTQSEMTTKDTRFAISVRDGADLWLFLSLKRDRKGNVYVFWPRDDPEWNPHASHHASGRAHHKSFRQ